MTCHIYRNTVLLLSLGLFTGCSLSEDDSERSNSSSQLREGVMDSNNANRSRTQPENYTAPVFNTTPPTTSTTQMTTSPSEKPEVDGDIGYISVATNTSSNDPIGVCWLSQPEFTTVFVEIESMVKHAQSCIEGRMFATDYFIAKVKPLEKVFGDDVSSVDELTISTSLVFTSLNPGWFKKGTTGIAVIRQANDQWVVHRWVTTYDPSVITAEKISQLELEDPDLPKIKNELISSIKQKTKNFYELCTHSGYESLTDERFSEFAFPKCAN